MTDEKEPLTLNERARAQIDALNPASREQLLKMVEDAAEAQRKMLGQAIDEAMAIVPAPFRKQVRKMFRQ